MSKIKVFCFGFGQVAKYFIKKIIKEKQFLELNVSSRKKNHIFKFEGLDINSYEFNEKKIDKNINIKIQDADFILVSIPPINDGDIVLKNFKSLKLQILLIIFFYSAVIIFIWQPYISSVDFDLFNNISMSITERFSLLIKYITLLVPFLLSVFSEEKSLYIRFLDPTVISSDLQLFKVAFLEAQQSIINIFIILILIAIKNKLFNSYKNFIFLTITYFVIFYTVITPIIGGNKFFQLDRMDQYLEVYPFYLILLF